LSRSAAWHAERSEARVTRDAGNRVVLDDAVIDDE
jgi:hypothetical protein